MEEGYSSVTWAPRRLWHSLWWKSSSHSWSRPHTDFHLSHTPKPLGPAACFRQQDRYSWGRRCSACARSPSHCRLQEAAGRWRHSPHCPYEECLMRAQKGNKKHLPVRLSRSKTGFCFPVHKEKCKCRFWEQGKIWNFCELNQLQCTPHYSYLGIFNITFCRH